MTWRSIPWAVVRKQPQRYIFLHAFPGAKGYEVNPVIYVVDQHGRIVWSDHNGRLRHEDTAPLMRQLESAIQRTPEKSP